jgi:hypothetical protein
MVFVISAMPYRKGQGWSNLLLAFRRTYRGSSQMRTSGIMTRELAKFYRPLNESTAFDTAQGAEYLMQLIRLRLIALYQVTAMPIVLFIGCGFAATVRVRRPRFFWKKSHDR